MNALRSMLGVYDDMDEKTIPRLFVLCGNFRSRPWLADGENIREYTGMSCDLTLCEYFVLTQFRASICRSFRSTLDPPHIVPFTSRSLSIPPRSRPDRSLVILRSTETSPSRITRQTSPCQNPESHSRYEPLSSEMVQPRDCHLQR